MYEVWVVGFEELVCLNDGFFGSKCVFFVDEFVVFVGLDWSCGVVFEIGFCCCFIEDVVC